MKYRNVMSTATADVIVISFAGILSGTKVLDKLKFWTKS